MQSTGQVSIASWINSSLSPSCLKALALPCSGSIAKVLVATELQYVQPIHFLSSTQTAFSLNFPPRTGSLPLSSKSSLLAASNAAFVS